MFSLEQIFGLVSTLDDVPNSDTPRERFHAFPAILWTQSGLAPNRGSSRREIVLTATPAASASSFWVRDVRHVVQLDQLAFASRQAISLWSGVRS